MMKKLLLIALAVFMASSMQAEDGYRLWLRYDRITDAGKLKQYNEHLKGYWLTHNSPTIQAIRDELKMALPGLLGSDVPEVSSAKNNGVLIVGKPDHPALQSLGLSTQLRDAGPEGFIIRSTTLNRKKVIVISGNEDAGLLSGVFHLSKLMQTPGDLNGVSVVSIPKITHRILNHWDNLDRTVERGYAGFSIWDWHKLPDHIDPRYRDYARANASIGINGTVVTNVNANALVLTPAYLEKVAALANVFRPYGVRIYLTARFNAPMELDKYSTADPLDPEVRKWWAAKAEEIYRYIPDFGGFVVKANSEGQPGPQNYNRTHADGANMLAEALAPHGGIVMWRAFVYDDKVPDDRHKQAYNEFVPHDGTLKDNVLIQVKNGAIDFQPREPFHPL